jgi:hypothetical protein
MVAGYVARVTIGHFARGVTKAIPDAFSFAPSVQAPSIWYEAVAAPQTKSGGNARLFPIIQSSYPYWDLFHLVFLHRFQHLARHCFGSLRSAGDVHQEKDGTKACTGLHPGNII